MSKPLRKGKVIFYDDHADEQPHKPSCVTWHIYHRNGGPWHPADRGGWFALLVTDQCAAFTKGPFLTERKAERVAREWAESCDCRFLP
jgi:hypothetical protein